VWKAHQRSLRPLAPVLHLRLTAAPYPEAFGELREAPQSLQKRDEREKKLAFGNSLSLSIELIGLLR
jgi:hypothetical protein